MAARYLAKGALSGIIIGTLFGLFYPQLIWDFLNSTPYAAQNPLIGWTVRGGSSLDMVKYTMLVGGFVGALLGFIFSKVRKTT